MFQQKTNIQQISAEEVKEIIENKKDFALIDVRTESEYLRGKIEGSVNLPLDHLAEKVEALFPDKNANIVVYCLSGARSVMAAEILQKKGYTKVSNLISGLLIWRIKGFPTVA